MKLIRKLVVRAAVLTAICYPLMWVAAWALGRRPMSPYIVAVIAATAAIVVSDDLDGEKG